MNRAHASGQSGENRAMRGEELSLRQNLNLTKLEVCSLYVPRRANLIARDAPEPINVNGADDWEASVDQVLAICDGDPRAARR
jgi:hypothetical protein